ncbi:MAG: NAD(P)-binding domain-containing protein [Thermoleophilaceae bacterium]
MRVGFVGLGIMGRPMARNIMRAGHELTVHSRSPGPVEELTGEGAEAADSPRAVAERCEAVITMVPDSPDVREVMLGEDGVLAGAIEGALAIDMSTISPAVAREVAAAADGRGVGALDAPVSGGESGAIEGRLSIMVGGSDEHFARAEEMLSAMGTPTHVGEAGAGQVSKACNQVIIAGVIQAVSEALVLGSKAGVDPQEDGPRPRRGPGGHPRHGGQGVELPGARLCAGVPRRAPPQGPGHRARHRARAWSLPTAHRAGRPAPRDARADRPR